MSEIVGLVVLILGGLVIFYKKRVEKATQDSFLGETRGEDKVLQENQEKLRKEIKETDETIKKLYEEREKLRNNYKTREERAEDWNKGRK